REREADLRRALRTRRLVHGNLVRSAVGLDDEAEIADDHRAVDGDASRTRRRVGAAIDLHAEGAVVAARRVEARASALEGAALHGQDVFARLREQHLAAARDAARSLRRSRDARL